MKTIAEKCLEFTSLFEAELLVRLLLRNWNHPFADDLEFANELLEGASEALRSAAAGMELIEGLPSKSLNFVAAVWYSENCAIESSETDVQITESRNEWLFAVRRALPSCFCDPSDLPPTA
jgi:hypothetical protein